MFGISQENILGHQELEEPPSELSAEDSMELRYNIVDPTVVRDGVDFVCVVDRSEEEFQLQYGGYENGKLRVTAEGMLQFGETLLRESEGVPSWIITSDTTDDFPHWVPDSYDPTQLYGCDHCGTSVEASDILEPGDSGDRFCQDCWEDVQNRWSPEVGFLLEPPTVDGVLALRDRAKENPGDLDVEEIAKFVKLEDQDLQYRALHALIDVIAVRPEAAIDYLPLLSERLASENGLVRCGALYCVADLAEDFPRQVTPFADDIIAMLSVDEGEGYLEGAIPYVAAVADAEPKTVLDAVPRLAALLQAGTPKEYELLLALSRIAKRYPDAIVPVTADLLEYIEDEAAENRGTALAAIGYVSKDYPDVAESAIPTLVDLLDAESQWLRANASGVLADISDEYPGQLRLAVDRVVDLLVDEDQRTRYNAMSILARVAEEYPADIEPATDLVVELLEDNFAYTRKNACWALGYMGAETARQDLEERRHVDSNEEVTEVAEWALQQIDQRE